MTVRTTTGARRRQSSGSVVPSANATETAAGASMSLLVPSSMPVIASRTNGRPMSISCRRVTSRPYTRSGGTTSPKWMRRKSAFRPMPGGESAPSLAGMTTTTIHPMQDERVAGGLALLITIVALAFANFSGSGENGGVGPYAVTVGVSAIVAAVLFGRVLPQAGDPARAAWILAGLAVLTCVAFWSGLPFVLGMGAVYSGGRAGRRAPVAIGALAVVAAFVGCVIG